jgi:hypothetical protein
MTMTKKKAVAKTTKSTETALTTQLARADAISRENLMSAGASGFEHARKMASALDELRKIFTGEVLETVAKMAGSPLGFKTDRDHKPQGYSQEQLKDVLIEACLRGYHPIGNEFNVIAGNFYAAKNGLRRKVQEYPGLDALDVKIGVPHVAKGGNGALVPAVIKYTYGGKAEEVHLNETSVGDFRIPCKGDQYATVDAYRGKAERKALAYLWGILNGTALPGESINDDDGELPTEVHHKAPEPVVEQVNGDVDMSDHTIWKKCEAMLDRCEDAASVNDLRRQWLDKCEEQHKPVVQKICDDRIDEIADMRESAAAAEQKTMI